MQDKKEVTAAIEKIRDIQKRTDMQGWNRENALKAELPEAKEREQRTDIEGEEHVYFLG